MFNNLSRALLLASLSFGLNATAQTSPSTPVSQMPAFETAFEQPLFKTLPGQTPYRIPAIATTRGGSLIAVTDYRPCGSDIGYGLVNLHYRLSHNNGRTWSPEMVLAQGDGFMGSPTCGYGDAAIVADRTSDEVIVVSVTGQTVYGAATTTRENPNRVAIQRSTDQGRTWSAPEDITERIYSLFDKSQLGPVQSLFFTSGRIAQSQRIRKGRYYRIYAALCARPGGNRVLYSDDFGRTWLPLGSIDSSPAPKGDEVKVEELPNGNLMLSSRTWGGRIFNIFSYISQRNATGVWGEPLLTADAQKGIVAEKNACNGEILIVDAVSRATGKIVPLALHSIPLGPGRARVGIYYKSLHSPSSYQSVSNLANDWSGPFEVTPINSAYSTMTLQADGRIGFFYEEETYGAGAAYTEMYRPLSIEQITQGEYRTPIQTKNKVKRKK